MKKTLTGLFVVIILILAFSLKSNELKIDDTFLIGNLENKLTYYIKENDFLEDKASLRLLVKVGSALESEQERGIAHFLEHLVFRGSENYKDYEIVKYLESIGAEFGPDTNAFTTFDKTCYMLDVPLKNKQDLEKAIAFLSEFAFKAKLEDKKIDQERPIVLDELRRSLGPEMRVYDKHLKVILEDTSYEDRSPIGKEEVIKNCSYETIRNFYKKWYTPHNMAIIAVGDFNKNEVKEYIEKYFSLNIENKAIPNYVVNPNKLMNFSIVNDPEISLATIELISKEKAFLVNSPKELEENIISNLIINILNERYKSISTKSNPDFISASFFEDIVLKNLCIAQLSIMCWEEKISQGLEKALYEVVRLNKMGVKEDEFKRAIKARKELIKKQINNLDKIDNVHYIDDCFDHFIYGSKIFSHKSILDFEDKFLDGLSFEDFFSKVKNFNFNYLCTVCITLPQKVVVNQADIAKMIETTKDAELFEEIDKNLNEQEFVIPKLEMEGEIKNINKDDKTNTTLVEFTNGLKVFLKPTDLKKNEIILRSFALNGLANLKEDIYDSAKIALDYFYNSGIAGIDTANFFKILDSKNSSLNINLTYNFRNISSNTTKDNFEDIIKLINRIFTSKNYQNDMWDKTIKIEKEKQKYCHLNPEVIFFEKANQLFTSNTYLLKEIDFNKISLKTAQDVINTFFSNPKDFKFFIVGDFEVEHVLPILKKYLGSISDKSETKIEMNNLPNINFPKENQTQIVRAGQEDKSFCLIGYELTSMDAHDVKQWYLFDLMRPIIKERLLNSLRLEEGKTYGVMNYPDFYFYPNLSHFNYFIGFSGPQEDINSIKNISLNSLKNLIKKGVLEKELETAKKIVKNDIKESLKSNTYFTDSMMTSQIFGLEEYEDYESIIDSISSKQMNSFIESLFSKDKYTSVIWLPKEK